MQSIKKELDQLFFEEKWQEIKNLTSHYSNKERHSEPSILLYAGAAEIETGNVHTGQKKIEQYLEKFKLNDAVAYFYLGRAFDLNKKSLLADDFYNKAIKIDPQKASYKIFKMVNLFNNSLFEEIKEIAKSDFEQWKSLDLFPLVVMTAYEQTSNEDQIPYEIIELCSRFAGQVGDQKTIRKYIDFLAKYDKKEKINEYIKTLKKRGGFNDEINYAKGLLEEKMGNLEEAEKIYKNSIEEKFNQLNASALIELTVKQNKIDVAVELLKNWISNEKNHINFKFLLGLIYTTTPNLVSNAIEIFKEALQETSDTKIQKNIKWNMSLALLTIGNLKEGWKNYRVRESTLLNRKFEAKLWDGKKIKNNDKIMVWSEQGIGDHIMFGTMLPDLLLKIGSDRIIFETEPRLLSLFQRSFPGIEVRKNPRLKIDLNPYVTDYKYHIPIGSLPCFFRKEIKDFPGHPIINVSEEWKNTLKERFSSERLKIGIIWRSQISDASRKKNYLTYRDLECLFHLDLKENKKIEWINLQYGECDEEIEKIRNEFGIDLKQWPDIDLKNDFDATAALISCLDLVISPSSSVLQLAGALGVRTWCFSLHPAWTMHGEEYYPWFHSIRMYQVPFPNEVKLALPQMAKDLKSWLSTGAPPPNKTRVIIDPSKAKQELESIPKNLESKGLFLLEHEAEEQLIMGAPLEEVKKKSVSIRLEKKIEDFLRNPNQYLVTSDPKPKLVGPIEEIKSLLSQQSQEELFFEVKENFRAGAQTLIISFQENVSYALPFTLVTPYFYPKFTWDEIVNEIDNVSVLQVRDSWQMWYQVGPLGSCLLTPNKSADRWVELIMSKIQKSGAKRLICVGTSAGASAAIQFGTKLNADAVIAISPQARPLDPDWELKNGGFNFFEYRSSWRKQLSNKYNLLPIDLRPYSDYLGDKLHLIIPKLNKTDTTHANYLIQDNPNIHLYRSTGKNHGDVNKKLIFDIIRKLI